MEQPKSIMDNVAAMKTVIEKADNDIMIKLMEKATGISKSECDNRFIEELNKNINEENANLKKNLTLSAAEANKQAKLNKDGNELAKEVDKQYNNIKRSNVVIKDITKEESEGNFLKEVSDYLEENNLSFSKDNGIDEKGRSKITFILLKKVEEFSMTIDSSFTVDVSEDVERVAY